ncbi:hypothetical protein BD410DRAFT_892464 [Rickenella mellea]|uniref:Uncharacterized protein n=1 Tax=Rickenella mellea TaxID=50990 RepID=A0A4R5XED7_9AGAM|nr:hypothetical protein BD410DRAFT_892464 [Rickenella mellea]
MTEKRPARIQAEDIDFLISALHRIKNHGGTLEDIMDIDAWFGDTNDWVEPEMSGHTDEWTYDFCEPDISTCMGCHRFPKDGRSLRDALRQLKAVDMVVKAIRKSLSQRLMCMGRKCARLELQDGLQRTPDEVLSVIFQFAYSSSGK